MSVSGRPLLGDSFGESLVGESPPGLGDTLGLLRIALGNW